MPKAGSHSTAACVCGQVSRVFSLFVAYRSPLAGFAIVSVLLHFKSIDKFLSELLSFSVLLAGSWAAVGA